MDSSPQYPGESSHEYTTRTEAWWAYCERSGVFDRLERSGRGAAQTSLSGLSGPPAQSPRAPIRFRVEESPGAVTLIVERDVAGVRGTT